MRAWIFSDLHTEVRRAEEPLSVPDADICLCAGDICDHGPASAVTYLGEHVSAKMPVVVVAGNHDYYRSSIVEGGREARARAKAFPDVYFLDRGIAFVGGYRFVGATLWGGTGLAVSPRTALYFAQREAEDYRKIKMSKRPSRAFSREQLGALIRNDMDFLKRALSETETVPTVVVTHHAPSRLSILPELLAESRCAADPGEFASEMVGHAPLVWVHGNLHNRSDYRIEATRVVCNPRGCPARPASDFDPRLVIELDGLRTR